MEKLPHFAWMKKGESEDAHYLACKKGGVPCVTISENHDEYVFVSYDSLPMYNQPVAAITSMESLERAERMERKKPKVLDKLKVFYNAYFEAFDLPEEHFCGAGGEDAFSFVVHKDHAGFFAEALYHFLVKNRDDWVRQFESS